MLNSARKPCLAINNGHCTGPGTQACCPPLIVLAVLSVEQPIKQVACTR